MANTVEIVIKGTDNATGAINGVKGALSGLSGGLKSAGAAMMGTGAKMTAGITAPLALIGSKSLSTAADFEASMKILTLAASSSGTAMEALSDAALAVGADTSLVGISAAESAEAMTNFYKAGLTTTDVFSDLEGYLAGNVELTGALRSAIDLAAASELDLATATDVVAIAMATFGLDADQASSIADSFVGAADASVASVGDLAEALKNVGPTMASFGFSLEDTNTALAILSTRGIQGGEAGTALKSMMTNLMRPTDAVVLTLEKLNVSLFDAAGNMMSLPEIIGQLEASMSGLTQEQKLQTIQTLAGTYGMKAMATLLEEGNGGWYEMAEAITNAASAQEVGTARTQGFNAAMEQLEGAIETLMIKAITPLLPKITGLVNQIGDFIGKIIEADPQLVQMGIVIAAVAAAAGPLLMVLGVISTVLGALISPIGLVVAAIAGLGVAWATNFLGIRDIVIPIIESIGSIIGGLLDLFSNSPGAVATLQGALMDAFGLTKIESLRWIGTIQGAFTTFKTIFSNIGTVVMGVFGLLTGAPSELLAALKSVFGLTHEEAMAWMGDIWGVVSSVKLFFTETIPAAMVSLWEMLIPIWQGIQNIIAAAWRNVESVIAVVIERVIPLIMNWIGTVRAIVEEAWPVIQNVITTVWGAIQEIIMMVMTQVVPKIIEGFGIVVQWFNDNWPAIQALIMEVWGAILDVIQYVVNLVVPFIQEQFQKVVDWVNENWPLIKKTITTVLDGILNTVKSVISWIKDFWKTNHDAIMTVATSVWNIIKNSISTIINTILGIIKAVMLAITGDWDTAWTLIKQVALDYWEALKTNFDETMTAIKTILDLIMPKIQELWDTVWTAIKDKAVEIWDDIKEFVDTTLKSINQTITRILSNTFEWITSKVTDWIQAGKDLVGGMAQGITDTVQRVVDAGKGIMNALKEAILSVELPIPTVSLSWETWNGIKYPSVGFGVRWQTIGSLTGLNAGNNTAQGAAQGAMGAAGNNALNSWGLIRGELMPDPSLIRGELMPDPSLIRGELMPDPSLIRGELMPDPSLIRGELWPMPGLVRSGGKGKKGDPLDPFGIGETWEGGGLGEGTSKDKTTFPVGSVVKGGSGGGSYGGGGGGSMGGSRIEELLTEIRDMVAIIAGSDPNSTFAGSDLEYKIAGLTA